MASCMNPARYETTSVKIDGGDHRFTISASLFVRFLSVNRFRRIFRPIHPADIFFRSFFSMNPARYETTSVKIDGGDHRFTISASKRIFDGFMSVYTQEEEKEENNTLGKGIDKNTELQLELSWSLYAGR